MIRIACYGFLLFSALPLMADPVYWTAALPSGTRTESQLIRVGNYAGDALTQSVSWNVTAVDGGFQYTYTFFNFSRPDISHVILEAEGRIWGANGPVETGASWGPAPSNPSFPAGETIDGVKFDFGGGTPFVISFFAELGPVWGSFYTKGGSNARNLGVIYNPGLTNSSSTHIADFLAVPGYRPSETPQEFYDEMAPLLSSGGAPLQATPEPGTYALAGLGLAALVWRRRGYLRSKIRKY